MPRLLLISMMRSGTNWFMELVGQLPGVLCMREAFNPNGVFGIEARDGAVREELQAHLGTPYVEVHDPELITFARRDPLGLLAISREAAGAAGFPWLGVTIFDDQVRAEDLREIFAEPDTLIVFLQRAHLPRIISLEKARSIGSFKKVDTTDHRPEVPLDAVFTGMEAADTWFAETIILAQTLGVSTATLTYETHVCGGAETTLTALKEAFPDLPWSQGQKTPASHVKRQDRNDSLAERIANGPALIDGLRAAGQLDRALGYPVVSIRS